MSDITTLMMAASGAGGGEETDPNFNQTVLLLHGDGTNGAQNNTFLDSSTPPKTITRNGNTTQGTFSPFSVAEGEWSNYFNGASNINFADSADFTFDADFTIECWFFCPILPTTNHIIFSKWDAGAQEFIFEYGVRSGSNARQVRFFWGPYSTGSALLSSASDAFNIGEWVHVAVTRSGSDCRLFINGTVAATATNGTAASDGGSALYLGRYSGSGVDYLTGYLSNASILKGTAKYTAAFTPSTTPLSPSATNQKLLTCYSNRFVDANTATTAKAVTVGAASVQPFSPFAPSAAYSASVNGGSGYFDGATDYLGCDEALDGLTNASDPFTVECWFYPTVVPASSFETMIAINQSGGATNELLLSIDTIGELRIHYNNVNTGTFGTINVNAWNHVAGVFDGTDFKAYLNGALVHTVSSTSPAVALSTCTFYLGTETDPGSVFGNYFEGYISSARVTESAVYTSAFTLPTAPFTAISGTSFLCNFTNAGIFDNTGKNNLETVGNAQIDTTTVKYGTGSMEFDGTGDYLKIPSNQNLVFGTGDFTIEFWLYFDAVNNSTVKFIYDFRNASATSASILAQESTNSWTYFDGTGSNLSTGWTSGTFTTGTWYHIAICRSSGTTNFFVDGTSTSSVADTSNYANGTFILASRYNGQDYLDGFIDDLRITKGVARYTTTFTPPTAPFPDQ